ncbi:M57 family metalloprotease [Aquimarina sp. 2201CG1-2-11]|uniref:M57 family metalloprotease n=1 Tax=Aquimarina discodermiae TaxID=3231043 RepID=UPI0034636EAC
MKKTIFKLLLVILTGIISSCEVDRDIDLTKETSIQTDGQKALEILEDLGFNTFNATIDNEYIIIEDDILMEIAFILENHKKGDSAIESKQSLSKKHTFYGGRVSNEYNNRVRFSMAENMQADWLPALQIAISRYNKVNECRVHMSYTTGSAHSHISYKNLGGNTLGWGEYPRKTIHSNLKIYRKPGTKIHIDPVRTRNTSLEDKIHLLMHEMGHNMGFDHVFDNATHKARFSFKGTQIAGTTIYEANSVMNADGYDSGGIFTVNDKRALQIIYPGPFISDFDQTIIGPRYADTYRSATYKTSVTSSANTYHWEYKNKVSNSWRNVPNGTTPSVTFKISTSVAYNPFNGIEVRCTIVKPNGDESRKSIITQVEGRGGPRF